MSAFADGISHLNYYIKVLGCNLAEWLLNAFACLSRVLVYVFVFLFHAFEVFRIVIFCTFLSLLERDRGVEPLFSAWKANVEPIN